MSGRFVNKLTADIHAAYCPEDKTVRCVRYTGNDLANRDIRKFVEIIFRNFEELKFNKTLNHNRKEISRLLTSPTSIIVLAMLDNIIIGYITADINVYHLKKLMHIYYLYTAPLNRGKGVATTLLNLIQDYAHELGIRTLSLTFDTYNKDLTRYYISNGFNFDPEIRSYQRHDMFIKYI